MAGNTVVDAVKKNLEVAQSTSQIVDEMGLQEGRFMLATLH